MQELRLPAAGLRLRRARAEPGRVLLEGGAVQAVPVPGRRLRLRRDRPQP